MPINQQNTYDYANPYNLPYYGVKQPTPPPNILGSDFSHLKGLLTGLMGGDPNKNLYMDYFNKVLGRQTGSAIKNINEQLASSGFRGAGANLINDVFETQANATQGFGVDLLKNDMAVKQNAINQLLGLNQFEGSQNFGMYQSQVQQEQFRQSLEERRRQFDLMQALQRDELNPSFWDVFGGILGTGVGAFTGGLGGGLASSLFSFSNFAKPAR